MSAQSQLVPLGDAEDAWRAHPTQQLAREKWVDLLGAWDFSFDDGDNGLLDGWCDGLAANHKILVPFPPESPASLINDTGPHRVAWYQRDVTVQPVGKDQCVVLHVGACDYATSIWCNGKLVGHHEGGSSPFACDLSSAMVDGCSQRLVLRVEDDPADLTQPRGKPDWRTEPHAVWYPRTTGIWQPVWLEYLDRRHIETLTWTADFDGASVSCQLRVSRPVPEGSVEVRLYVRGELLCAYTDRLQDRRSKVTTLIIPGASNPMDRDDLAWSPESPTVVEAEVVLSGPDGTVIDLVRSYFGFRVVSVRDGRFFLNAKPYFLRMALEQGIWPETHLAAPSDERLKLEVELAKALGFNGVRVHQKIEDPRFLAWCDRVGLLVWEEMPSAYEFSGLSVRRLMTEWMEVIERDGSHPCIVCWVPLNESWGVPALVDDPAQRAFAVALSRVTRAMDPTRPVVSNDGWEHVDSDILTVHDYTPIAEVLRARYGDDEAVAATLRDGYPGHHRLVLDTVGQQLGPPVMVTEFGGLSIEPASPLPSEFAYTVFSSASELAERFEAMFAALNSSTAIAGFCYTQLTDTFQERNGLLDGERRPKVPLERVRAAVRGETSEPRSEYRHDG